MSSKPFDASGEAKSWKKLNEERKALKKERRQQKLIQSSEVVAKLKEQAEKQKNEVQQVPKPAHSTISLAVPGSILENTQSPQLGAYVAGQVARSAAIFRVTEIIVFDDICVATPREQVRLKEPGEEDEEKVRIVRRSSMRLAKILQYLECPQYLRRYCFPMHKDLQYSGLLNPLDTPHHLRQQSVFRYREGVITERAAKPGHSYANVGLLNDVMVDKPLNAGVRVTVRLDNLKENSKKLRGTVVSPDEPRRETGVYWGYNVRIASCLSDIFAESPYQGGYDLTVGTSDRGKSVQSLEPRELNYNHLLIVFGGLKGLENALTNDDKLNEQDPSLLFDHYINVLPRQGSRTIRTEEALLIALTALQEKLNAKVPEVEEELIDEVLPSSTDTSSQLPAVTAPLNKKRKIPIYENNEQNLSGEESGNSFEKSKNWHNKNDNYKNPFGAKKVAKYNDDAHKNGDFKTKTFKKEFNDKKTEHENTSDSGEKKSGNPFNKGKNWQNKNESFKKPRVKYNDHVQKMPKTLDDDFEVVTANTKTKSNTSEVDLSRFD